MWPTTRAEFDTYWNSACERVAIDSTVHAYLTDLIDLRMVPWFVRLPFKNLLRFLTIGFLAPVFREQLEVDWSPADDRRFTRLFAFVAFVNRFLPRFVRHGGTYLMMRDLRRRMRKGKRLV